MPDVAFVNVSSLLIAGSAAVIALLGIAHLWITFRGTQLHPRDADLMTRMDEVSPVLTRQTTMWKTWIGFNASHSFGALLFGAVYGYLALFHSAFLFRSPFLLGLGLVFLAGLLVLGKLYWFSVPFRAITLATGLYVAALLLAFGAVSIHANLTVRPGQDASFNRTAFLQSGAARIER